MHKRPEPCVQPPLLKIGYVHYNPLALLEVDIARSGIPDEH
ncbi:MAG TPA: hypothetical protein VIF10_00305 [Methylobacter sp.]